MEFAREKRECECPAVGEGMSEDFGVGGEFGEDIESGGETREGISGRGEDVGSGGCEEEDGGVWMESVVESCVFGDVFWGGIEPGAEQDEVRRF
ncbi:uncharacterized protein EAF02_007055 [Botrytis sinoallii]|uniref:uncharacterized protein n=1 Tax=Botrytis sinoallii TaxID=1463999 RepID=UPI0019012999|nr:uncharacterized protein EAF02_007055 [Botrytis sinoallii]KAF7881164.1 hypothetical protein EAF02_007055 [Botrytis sinoallii]